jgi:ribonuclease P protein component
LTERRQFDAVRAHDWAVAGQYFVVRARPSELSTARLGIIAARRAIRRAIDRNTCKRIARSVFHERKETLEGLDVVVICRAALSARTRIRARCELERLLIGISENTNRRAATRMITSAFQEKR